MLAQVGIGHVYSFHMVLSNSRDPFTRFTPSMDLATFWDCHRRAFAHFGGVPGSIVYDRHQDRLKHHVAPRAAVPLHPEAAAFAEHYRSDGLCEWLLKRRSLFRRLLLGRCGRSCSRMS